MQYSFQAFQSGIGVVGAASADLFSTSFPATENPISQSSIWTNGLAVGVDWNNVKTAGRALGTVDMGAQRYADNICHLKKTYIDFADNHYAQGTLYIAPGYVGNGGYHECSLYTRMEIIANNARGYETIFGIGPSALAYIAVVRWEGPYGTYTVLFDTQLTPPAPTYHVDGLVCRSEVVGTNVLVYTGGVLRYTVATGGTFTEGQPGLGFWPADGGQHDNMGWASYQAGNT